MHSFLGRGKAAARPFQLDRDEAPSVDYQKIWNARTCPERSEDLRLNRLPETAGWVVKPEHVVRQRDVEELRAGAVQCLLGTAAAHHTALGEKFDETLVRKVYMRRLLQLLSAAPGCLSGPALFFEGGLSGVGLRRILQGLAVNDPAQDADRPSDLPALQF